MASGRLGLDDLYTVRKGELVRDNIAERLCVAEEEIVKVKEKEGCRVCRFYDEEGRACRIYDHRPAQCAALACWDTEAFFKVYEKPKMTRQTIVQDKVLLGLMAEHEKRCSHTRLERAVRRIEPEGEAPVKEILEALKFDHALRPFVSKKLGLSPESMDFIFGRPLMETILTFGLEVRKEPDGSFFLTAKTR